MHRPLQVVLATNVLVAALRSRQGASYRLLSLVGRSDRFTVNVSVPIVLEYESVLIRPEIAPALTPSQIDAVIDYICSAARRQDIHYLWRPFLRDPKDDMVLELAVVSGCDCIVTFNQRDFGGAERFGMRVMNPREFLAEIGEIS